MGGKPSLATAKESEPTGDDPLRGALEVFYAARVVAAAQLCGAHVSLTRGRSRSMDAAVAGQGAADRAESSA